MSMPARACSSIWPRFRVARVRIASTSRAEPMIRIVTPVVNFRRLKPAKDSFSR